LNKTTLLGLTLGVIAVAMFAPLAVTMLDFIAIGALNCSSIFSIRTCCFDDLDNDGNVVKRCTTCIDNGDGTYRDCTTETSPPLTRPEGGIFGDIPTPGPAAQDTTGPGIFQGDIIPTPGPAAQDMPRPGIFQGNLLESYSLPGLVQSDPDSEIPPATEETQPPATEETQPPATEET
jgi:hypothetical protein